ncbi:unnamed protein product [Hermetia illucens]|uniref:ISXO2-like transposase domain-containing protein n=1 Tax=Hermetia illucens TaxID=343691 RepID=A0A7R8UBT5_HERIL|nr:unnamed protein product [Hermetia illucens]
MYFITVNLPKFSFLLEEFQASSHTIVDWNNFLREVLVDWAFQKTCKEKLGGVGKTVEVDEAKLGKRKYNRGRIIEGQWIFGAIERETKKIFVVAVPDRTHETLLSIIVERIEKGTKIISDCWPSYSRLEEYGFIHETVNHSKNFIDPQSGAHTQNIERNWRELRSKIPKYGRKKDHYAGYLAEYMFLRTYPAIRDRVHEMFQAIGQLYNPSGQTGSVGGETEIVGEDIGRRNEEEEEYEEVEIYLDEWCECYE